MLKNFLFVLSRFRASSLLNIIGLSVAFTVFIIIMMQADYDLRFDKSVKNSDRIFRIEFIGGISGERQAVICRPMLELIFKASPHIVAGSLMSGWTSESFLKVENEGKQSLFKVIGQGIDSAFVSVFQPEMVEGSAHAIEDPNTVLIPLSLARKMFGQTSAVGKQVQADNNTSQTIGAVYRDFPDNSSVQNAVYYNIGNENKNSWGNFNYNAFVLLDNPAVVAEVVEQMRKAIPLDNEVFRFGENHTFRLDALKDLHFINDVSWDRTPKASRQKLALLFAIAFAILIIAAINFVNFSMALVPGRIRSINTQKILGATLTELRVKLVSEAAIMCLVSFVLALILVYMLSDVQLVAGLIDAKMNLLAFPRLIGLSAVIALALGVFAGLYPAFYSTSVPPALALKGTFGLSPQGRM
ncbi:MAG: ABC transporter permease, partial [Dysgonamonadaceae bacterium]|nr:ABC transporter permease [Dysgonamonadaceae bacterium]